MSVLDTRLKAFAAAIKTKLDALTARFLKGPYVSVADFAGSNGVIDGTAIQAALNYRAGTIALPPGTFTSTSPLAYAFAGQKLVGGGVSSTILNVPTGTSSSLVCNGLNSCGIDGIKLKGSGNTGGELLLIENCSGFIAKDSRIETGYRGVTCLSTNNTTFENTVFADHTGDYGLRFAGTSTTRADVLKIRGCEFSHFSNHSITGILWESYAHSMTVHDVRFIQGGKSLHIRDSSGTGTDLAIPSFLQIDIFESDSPTGEAIRADDLRDAWIDNVYANGAIGANGLHFGSNAWAIRLDKARVGSSAFHGLYIAGRHVQVALSRLYANGQSASNSYDGIFVDSTASDVEIADCSSGYDNNFGTQQRWGLNIDPPAVRVMYGGNNFFGNLSGHINGGTDLGYRVGSSNRHSFYNGNGKHLDVGGSTANVVNNFRIAGGAAGSDPQLLAEGSDANLRVKLVPKGTAPVSILIANVQNFANDAAAATGGLQIGDIYRNGSQLMVRVS